SKGSVLFFKGQNSIANEIAASLKKEGFRIIEVREGGAFEKVDDDRYTIGSSCDDLESLLEHINENTFNYIVHSYALSQSDENISLELLNTEFNSSLLSLFNLTKVLINHNIKVINNTVLLTDYAYDIESKNESKKLINPLHAALMGLASVVSNEYVNLKLKCIDIDKYAQSDALINEFMAQDEMYCVSYRNNIRYVREINQVELNQFEESRVEIKHDGVYIVTGGTGALGLSVSKYLSNKNRVKICLINRSKFPPREEWDTILKTDDKLNKNTKKLASKISDILEIEKNGSEVCLLNSDISDAKSLKSAIDTIKSRYGGINGVIHAAGVAGQGFIFNKDEKAFKDVLAPKIYGTWILDSLTRDENPDFLILFSSISSFMAEMGQGDYAAANAYLDAYAEYRTLMGYKTVAINWPAWRETGMAVEFDVNFDKEIFNPINTKDALFRMEQILDRNIESIVPTKINYKNFDEIGYKLPFAISKKLQQNIKKYKSNISGNSIESNSISNVVIKGKAEDKITQTERKLAKLWSKILGVEELNVNDKFQSLGGDSILSTELLKLMDSEFSGMVDIADIFTYSTIASMAAYIEGLIKDKEEITQSDSKSLTMEEVFIQLERGEISPEEADKLITAL
ncbi:MAG: SDR family oxidoreductase, partial [Bacillota bacterium]|nr:SDR family oxidoreductase [Bacillota bacterium]